MTDKIIKMAHGNIEYNLGDSTNNNCQVLSFEYHKYTNKYASGEILLYRLASDLAVVKLRLYDLYIQYDGSEIEFPGIREEFIPKKTKYFTYNIDGIEFEIQITNKGILIVGSTGENKKIQGRTRAYEAERMYSLSDTYIYGG